MKRRTVVLFLVAFAATAVAIVAGASAHSSAQPYKGVKITMWAPPTGFLPLGFDKMVKRYEALSGVDVDVVKFPLPVEQNILAKWATGEYPDLLWWNASGNWLIQLNPEKTLRPLNDEAFVKKSVPGILKNSVGLKGKIYAAEYTAPYVDGIYYNKQVFAKYKLKVPQNFSQLVKTCETIKQNAPDVAPIFDAGGDAWPLQVFPFLEWSNAIKKDPQLINKLNQGKVKFSDPVFVQGMKNQITLLKSGCFNSNITTAKFSDQQDAIIKGKAAMIFMGSWVVPALQGTYGLPAVNKNIGFACYSTKSALCAWQATNGLFLPKSGDDTREAAALDFLRYTTGSGYKEFLKGTGEFPMLKGAPTPKNVSKVNVQGYDAFRSNSVPAFSQTMLAAYGPWEVFLQQMIAGKLTPQQVGDKLQKEMVKSARLIGLPGF